MYWIALAGPTVKCREGLNELHYVYLSKARFDSGCRNGLCTLACTAKHRHLAPAVFSARDGHTTCPAVLAAAMLQHRGQRGLHLIHFMLFSWKGLFTHQGASALGKCFIADS